VRQPGPGSKPSGEGRSRGPARLPTARELAARVLERVARDGAYASVALDAELGRYPQLDGRERALATELAYGCLRTGVALDARLLALAPKGIAGGDERVRIALRVAAYQLLFLDRVPPHAAVNAAVGAVRALRGKRVAGFANAVLRRLAEQRGQLEFAGAVLETVPEWLRDGLTEDIGRDEARALVGAVDRASPPLAIRFVRGRELPAWALQAPCGRACSRARLISGLGDPRDLLGWDTGDFVVQEEGAQVIALALGARPGERVLDACSGRGQKTSLLREQLGADAELWATDLYPTKLDALAREFERLHLAAPTMRAVDWTVGHADVPDHFDRVLVDAPCTGVGTLRRRPEILGRLAPRDPERLAELSERILRRAASRARVGGRVVFSVCSVLEPECEAVVTRVGDLLEPVPFDAPGLAALAPAPAHHLRLLPGRHGTDGYFVASFRRR